MKIAKKHISSRNFLFVAFFTFSWWLMWHTFRLDSFGNMKIATKVWSDFGASIPLIRSFSFGNNFPPQYPLFSGPPIRYHFLFFFFVGFFEKLGVPLDWALNVPSVVGFFLLLVAIYTLAATVFKKHSVATLSVLLFLFNGSFSFTNFFKKNPLSTSTFRDIVTNNKFSSFGPYDEGTISAFWNLNIFTNQRHLALSYAVFLFVILAIWKYSKHPKEFSINRVLLLGILVGSFPFVHMAVFGMMGLAIILSLTLYPKIRGKIFLLGLVALVLAIPQLMYVGASAPEGLIKLGYLVKKLTLANFFNYWLANIGLAAILGVFGLLQASRSQRKIFIPFLALFIAGNTIRFTPEIAANHKFFNLFVIGLNMFTAFTLYKLWNKKFAGKILFGILLFFLTLSGVIDLFTIANDTRITLPDLQNNPTARYIYENTPGDSIFLNSTYFFTPASIAGRKIFFGWPYFAWSAGYDTNKRDKEIRLALNPQSKQDYCNIVGVHNIDYVTIQEDSDFEINNEFFERQPPLFHTDEGVSIYFANAYCP